MIDLETAEAKARKEIPILGATAAELGGLRRFFDSAKKPEPLGLSELHTYCVFVGYPRSGHSLVGALLDAHPEMVIAHELDVIKFVEAGFERWQVEWLLAENARLSALINRVWGPYSYGVPVQWQGRWRNIKVLGDKKGGQTSLWIANDRARLTRLREYFGGTVKFIHVVRNPFDMIATLERKSPYNLEQSADRVMLLAETNQFIRDQLRGIDIIDVHHDAFSNDPQTALAELGEFLGVSADSDYLEACAKIVRPNPNRSRSGPEWPSKLIDHVTTQTAEFEFFSRYSFEN